MSWLRGEEVASVILETAFSNPAPPPALNVVNPRSAPWEEMISAVRSAMLYRASSVVGVVPFGQWFAQLEDKAANGASENDIVSKFRRACVAE